MKQIIILSALLTSFSGYILAQPVLSQSDIGLQIGDIQVIDSTDYVDMSSQTGPNMTWDLSDLIPHGIPLTAEVVIPSSTSSGEEFPSSTIARTFNYMGFTLDQFFNFEGSSMQHLGTIFSFGSTEYVTTFEDPAFALPFPMTYGDSGSDTYAAEQTGSPAVVNSSGEINWEVPGWGTLLVNGQSYTDVLMYKYTTIDTLVTSISGFNFVSYDNEKTYFFMAAGYHYPIVIFTEIETSESGFPADTTFSASILLSQTTGLESVNNILPDLRVYPNPSQNGDFALSFTLHDSEDLVLELFDLTGRSVYVESFTETPGKVNKQIAIPSHIDSGIYLLQLKTRAGQQMIQVEFQ